MKEPTREIAEDRELTAEEVDLVRWLLENGKPEARSYLPEVDRLRVAARCACGCASVDFFSAPGLGVEVLSDYQWEDKEGRLFGVFVFSRRGVLAGLEVWSIDGQETPRVLPHISILRPLG